MMANDVRSHARPRCRWLPAALALMGVLLLAGCSSGSTAAPSSSPAAGTDAGTAGGAGSATTATTRPATSGPTATSGPPRTTASTTATTTALTAQTTIRPAGGGAVEGTVLASPSCGVERPDDPCPPLPVAAHIEAYDDAGGLVRSTDADVAGRFSLVLAPGHYVLKAGTGTVFPSCRPFPLTMPETGAVRADITCDTGIR